ncbi:Suppressor of cytokine signaling 6, partial [Galemys pyrenaicus]
MSFPSQHPHSLKMRKLKSRVSASFHSHHSNPSPRPIGLQILRQVMLEHIFTIFSLKLYAKNKTINRRDQNLKMETALCLWRRDGSFQRIASLLSELFTQGNVCSSLSSTRCFSENEAQVDQHLVVAPEIFVAQSANGLTSQASHCKAHESLARVWRRPFTLTTAKSRGTSVDSLAQISHVSESRHWHLNFDPDSAWGASVYDPTESSGSRDCSLLVQESSDDRYLLDSSSLSHGKTLHTRIEHSNSRFCFYEQPDVEGHCLDLQFTVWIRPSEYQD